MSAIETQKSDIKEDVNKVEEEEDEEEEQEEDEDDTTLGATEEKKEIVTPEASFSLSVRQDKLVAYLSALACVSEEMTLNFTKDGVTVRQMDTSHIYMVDGSIPTKTFSAYTVNTEGKITVNVDTIKRIAKRADKEDTVTLSIEANRLKVGLPNRSFQLGTFENSEDSPTPKVSLKTRVRLSVNALLKALTDVSLADQDCVRIEAHGNEVRLLAKGDYVEADIGLDKKNTLEVFVEGAVSSMYSLPLLKQIVQASKDVADVVSIEYDANMPISFTFDTLKFLLAPRIE